MRKVFITILIVTTAISATALAGSIELKTSFPAPIGLFDRLRLIPRAQIDVIGSACDIGTMYVNAADNNEIYFCKDVAGAGQWDRYTSIIGNGIWSGSTGLTPNKVWLTDPTDKVGINTQTPLFRFHIAEEGTIIAKSRISSPGNHSGAMLLFHGGKGAFRSGRTSGSQWHDSNIGLWSVALNEDTIANPGTVIFAGTHSSAVAMGKGTQAGNTGATSYYGQAALGLNTLAEGNFSIAMGEGARALPSAWHKNFVIGKNTTAAGNLSVVMGEGSNLTGGTYSVLGGLNSWAWGFGNWVVGLGDDARPLKHYSVALGKNVDANAPYSTAMGENNTTTATADYGMAMGHGTIASALYATAMGEATTASGQYSLAMGQNSQTKSNYSLAMGYSTVAGVSGATGQYALATGYDTEATGQSSISMGHGTSDGATSASGDNSIAMGMDVVASGNGSIAMGQGITAQGVNTMAISLYDHSAQPAVVTANSVVIHTGPNGSVGIGKMNPDFANYKLDVTGTIQSTGNCTTSDIRLKKDIKPIDSALERITKIHGVNFRWKNSDLRGEGVQMGLIAQDVEKVFPEVVYTDSDGVKAMGYGKLVGAATEAIKELYSEMIDIQSRSDELKKRIDAVEEVIESSF